MVLLIIGTATWSIKDVSILCLLTLLLKFLILGTDNGFICSSGRPISDEKVCDGTEDCQDGGDESVLICTAGMYSHNPALQTR